MENIWARPSWLTLGRHVVAVVLVLCALNPYIYFSQDKADAVMLASVSSAVAIALAACITALWALFFTESSRGKHQKHFLIILWTLVVLLMMGWWGDLSRSKKTLQPPVAAAANEHRPMAMSSLVIEPQRDGTVLVAVGNGQLDPGQAQKFSSLEEAFSAAKEVLAPVK
jgi:hypothetical protein